MRWEKLETQIKNGELVGPTSAGPGKRWGHTCNSIRGGRYLYVFGGYGKDNCRSNQIHIFDTANRTWSEPAVHGEQPKPRDSHSCTAVEDNLVIFGGTDGTNPLKDLHIFYTSSNTWKSPCIRGEGPVAREGHTAVLVGKRIFIYGGCSKSSNSSHEEYYNDLYVLNTETYVWKRAETSGAPPSKRDAHSCSVWKNKLIVIGGLDLDGFYQSDVHILDTDSLVWEKLNTSGQLLPPRAGHTAAVLGKNLFVFGGFQDDENVFDDVHMLDVETGCWTKVTPTGEGPSARFSMAGGSLDPWNRGVLVFVGGCDKNLEALDDMYYLITGILIEPERDDRRIEKLSLRKQLKRKCQEQHIVAPMYDRAETNYQPRRQTPSGKIIFQAKVATSSLDNCTIETVIDGIRLRGVIFPTKMGGDNHTRR